MNQNTPQVASRSPLRGYNQQQGSRGDGRPEEEEGPAQLHSGLREGRSPKPGWNSCQDPETTTTGTQTALLPGMGPTSSMSSGLLPSAPAFLYESLDSLSAPRTGQKTGHRTALLPPIWGRPPRPSSAQAASASCAPKCWDGSRAARLTLSGV